MIIPIYRITLGGKAYSVTSHESWTKLRMELKKMPASFNFSLQSPQALLICWKTLQHKVVIPYGIPKEKSFQHCEYSRYANKPNMIIYTILSAFRLAEFHVPVMPLLAELACLAVLSIP